jgi:hypothetical protein
MAAAPLPKPPVARFLARLSLYKFDVWLKSGVFAPLFFNEEMLLSKNAGIMPAFFCVCCSLTMDIKIITIWVMPACILTVTTNSHAVDLRIAAELMHFDYEETDTLGNTLNQETGFIPGFTLAAAQPYRRINNTFEFSLFDGQVDYAGSTQTGQPHHTTTEESIYRLLYKLSWSPLSTEAAFYGKTYWQQWDRDIQASNGVQGLFERYQWWTVEAGAELPFIKKDNQSLLLELGLLASLNGTIMIDLANAGFGSPTLDLGNSIGFAGELKYEFRQTSNSSLQFGVQFKTWEFARSNSKTISDGSSFVTITEPDSTTVQTTLSASYIHHF